MPSFEMTLSEFFCGGGVGKVGGHLGASGSFTKQDKISEQALLMHKTQATHTHTIA